MLYPAEWDAVPIQDPTLRRLVWQANSTGLLMTPTDIKEQRSANSQEDGKDSTQAGTRHKRT